MAGIKSELECLICMFRQGLNTAKIATDEKEKQRKVLNLIAREIERVNLNLPPAVISKRVYEIVSDVTGIEDPFKYIKEKSNREALSMLPQLKEKVSSSKDSLYSALLVAVAGNIIDLGIGHSYNLSEDVERIINSRFALDDYKKFKVEIKNKKNLLYLGDNAGEIVFDRVLVEELLKRGVNVKFCVKSKPIINDATMEDAKIAGLTELVPVIETGNNSIGIDFESIREELKEEFLKVDLILAKGHGNFETCYGLPYNIYFLLKAKCDVVSRALGVRTGDIVFIKQR